MSLFLSKETLEAIESWAEILAFVFTFMGAAAGVTYLLANRPLKRIEAAALAKERIDAETARKELEKKVADAQRETAKVSGENIKLKGEIDRSTAETKLQEEELHRKNLETEAKLEDERRTRLEFEKSLSPRVLPMKMGPGGKTNFDSLKPFAGMPAVIEYLPEPETTRAANFIRQFINAAGWKVVSMTPRVDLNAGYSDGVEIEHLVSPSEGGFGTPEDLAGKALAAFLQSYGWQAHAGHRSKYVPPNTVKITVGLKPNRYLEEKVFEIPVKPPKP